MSRIWVKLVKHHRMMKNETADRTEADVME